MSLNAPDPSQTMATAQANAMQTAAQQQTYNKQSAEESQAGSMVNQYNPYGSLTYSQSGTGPGGVPMWSANLNLTPEQQALFDTLQGTKGTAAKQAGSLLSGANYGGQSPADVIGGMTSGTTGELLNKEVSYLQPFQETERNQLDTKLRNQGLVPGQPGYDQAMRSLDSSHSLSVQDFLAKAEPAAYAQSLSTYEEPWKLASQEAGFGAPGSPKDSMVQTPGLTEQPANLIAATANAQDAAMKQYQAQQAQYSNMMSGAFGIPTAILGGWAGSPSGGAAISSMFSDENLKENIIEVGKTHDDIPIKLFNYKGDDAPRLGVMAQDVEKVNPAAVFETESGYKAVDYVRALMGT